MPDAAPNPAFSTSPPPSDRMARRKKLLSIFAVILVMIAAGVGLWNWLIGSHYVSTDNAYVGGDIALITPQLNAAVAGVQVADSQPVKANDVLVVLDDSDARIAVAKAEADLASAIRHVRQINANSRALQADIGNRAAVILHVEATERQAQSALEKAQIDLRRREELQASGAVSAEELTIARNALIAAQAIRSGAEADLVQAKSAEIAATAQFDANEALVAGKSVDDNPEVLSARARLDQAKLDLSRTVIAAPVDGIVTARHAQIGQRVKVGDVLMSVVPIAQLYVDANFKENQLEKVRPGQAVELTSDLYGSGVVFHGKVTGFSGGTGASIAIIPAQNATGNWIKVVQRLPVRVSLDPAELVSHPLRIGLTMDATVSLRDTH